MIKKKVFYHVITTVVFSLSRTWYVVFEIEIQAQHDKKIVDQADHAILLPPGNISYVRVDNIGQGLYSTLLLK